jgi:hypothetical protein
VSLLSAVVLDEFDSWYVVASPLPLIKAKKSLVNPEGAWTVFVLADPALIHGKLGLVAAHLSDRTTGEVSPEQLWHHGKALKMIQSRLGGKAEDVSESTLGTIALLASIGGHTRGFEKQRDTHLNVLFALIEARGGIDAPTLPEHLKRVFSWLDILRSTLEATPPTLTLSHLAVTATHDEFRSAAGPEFAFKPLNFQHRVQPLKTLSVILQQVALLSYVKSMPSINRSKRLRKLFSNTLWRVEWNTLVLKESEQSQSIWGRRSTLDAFRDAVLVCTNSSLRLQNAILIYSKLVQRLRGQVAVVTDAAMAELLPSDEIRLLLWIMAMGYKASLLGHRDAEDSECFLYAMTELIAKYGLRSQTMSELLVEGPGSKLLRMGLEDWEAHRLCGELRKSLDLRLNASSQ